MPRDHNFQLHPDDDGNLTSDGRWEYTWNAENRLIKMETTATARTAGVPWIVIDCIYDYMGRRISRKQTDNDSGGNPTASTEHHYRYDGWNCVARTTATWDKAIYYTWGTDLSGTSQGAGGVGGLLGVRHEVSSATTHRSSPCYDGNGNVVAYIDTSGGIITRYEYDPFGNLIRSGGAVNGESELHLFSTKPIDTASGLYYYGYRYYDPVTGRWPSRDPIEEEGGLNLYAFARNDSPNQWDILGLTVPNAPKAKERKWNRKSGRTDTTWHMYGKMRKLWFRKIWRVKAKGKLKITVWLDPRTESSPSPISLENGVSIRKHEYKHVAHATDNWNTAAAKSNALEGDYCHKPCAQIATDLINLYSLYYLSKKQKEDKQYDWDAYAKAFPDTNLYKKNIKAKLDAATAKMKSTGEKIKIQKAKWKAEKCPR